MIARLHESLAARLAARKDGEDGFTLIELLVVVLIIGILAAIAIPIFLNQQGQAKDGEVKSDLANAKIAYSSYLVANPTGTSTAAATALTPFGFQQSQDATTPTIVTGGSSFCIEEPLLSDSTKYAHVSSSGGVVTTAGTGTHGSAGGC